MTDITVKATDDNTGYEIAVMGHAGFNPGNDVVCAAVSTITFTLLQAVLSMEAEGKAYNVFHTRGDGEFILRFNVRGFARRTAYAVIRALVDGYRLIEEQNPNYVAVHGEKSPKQHFTIGL